MLEPPVVLTDGYDCYIRIKRGVYTKAGRRGQRAGGIYSDFQPPPRWKPARLCEYDASETITCERCGSYDQGYAETGERSYCRNQGKGWEKVVTWRPRGDDGRGSVSA